MRNMLYLSNKQNILTIIFKKFNSLMKILNICFQKKLKEITYSFYNNIYTKSLLYD